MIKTVKYLILALFCGIGSAHALEAPQLIGEYGDWAAYTYTENGKKVCYMASVPKRDEGRYTRRGDINVVVTHRPGENSFDVFNIVAGYTYKKNADVVIKIGNKTFKNLFTDEDKAWTLTEADDQALVAAMKRGERMIIDGVSSRGTKTKDTYSLKGFMRAYKAISAKCGKK